MSRRISYDTRILIIQDYFGVSRDAAVYMYHRRRRAAPFKDESDRNYLGWSLTLQNALVMADSTSNWAWSSMRFGEETKTLDLANTNTDSRTPYRNIVPSEWKTVRSYKNPTRHLERMGFIL